MYLLIDTNEFKTVRLALWQGTKVKRLEKQVNQNLSEQLIFVIEDFLKSNKTKLSELSGIAVVVGKGSFSRIRTGVATTNALGFVHKLPVISVEAGQDMKRLKFPKGRNLILQALPKYEREPNITKSKKIMRHL